MFKAMKWVFAPFFYMMIYAAIMGKEGLKEYPIGDERLLWEEYLIIVAIVIFYDLVRFAIRKYKG